MEYACMLASTIVLGIAASIVIYMLAGFAILRSAQPVELSFRYTLLIVALILALAPWCSGGFSSHSIAWNPLPIHAV